MRRLIAIATVLCGLSTAGVAQEAVKFSGYLFGDYFYVSQNHNKDLEGRNGFWIRQIHFICDRAIAENFAARLRFAMAHPGNFTAGKAVPFVKDAYLKWNLGAHQLYVGISPTPTFQVIEQIWGYRSVEKTPP